MQVYMEETEEMLQKAEECIIRLEMDYSAVDVNELFRIAHTIKGSSYMIGYEEIGSIMHKIEDMLDCARNGTIRFDQKIVALCFEALDIVKKMLQYKTEPCSEEITASLLNSALKISETVEIFIRNNKKEKKKQVTLKPEMGIVSSLLNKATRGKNKYFITLFIEEDAPMTSPVLLMILQCVEKIGTLMYSSFKDNYFEQGSSDSEIKTFDIMICTDVEEVELYTYFALFYVEKINIVDMSRGKLEENDYYFNDNCNDAYKIILTTSRKLYNLLSKEDTEYHKKDEVNLIEILRKDTIRAFHNIKNEKTNSFIKDFNEIFNLVIRIYDGRLIADEKKQVAIKIKMLKLLERAYNYTKGKYLFCVFKSGKDDFISRFRSFIEIMNRSSTLIILIDLSQLKLLQEEDVKSLIEIKKDLKNQEIEIGIVAEGTSTSARKIINIFDSIKPIEKFSVFRSEFEAVIGMLL